MQTKKRVLFKSQFEQMEIAYKNNEAKKFYEELSIIRKGFKPDITNQRYRHDVTC